MLHKSPCLFGLLDVVHLSGPWVTYPWVVASAEIWHSGSMSFWRVLRCSGCKYHLVEEMLKFPLATSSPVGVCQKAGLQRKHMGESARPRDGSANVAGCPAFPVREIRVTMTSQSNAN